MTKLSGLEAALELAAVSPVREGVRRDDLRSGSEQSARDSEEVQSSNDSKMQLEDIQQERAANLLKTSLRHCNKFAYWAVALCAIMTIAVGIYFQYSMGAQITAQSDQIVKMKAQMAVQSDQIANQIILINANLTALQQRRDNNAAQDSKDAGRQSNQISAKFASIQAALSRVNQTLLDRAEETVLHVKGIETKTDANALKLASHEGPRPGPSRV